MRTCYVIGRKAILATNGHEYVAEPFIVFETLDEAEAACDMVEKVSGERPKMAEAALYKFGKVATGALKAQD